MEDYTKPKLVIVPRENGFAIEKHRELRIVRQGISRELVAIFKNQPDGSIIRTFTYKGFPNLEFPDLDTVKEWYGIE